MDKSVVFIVPIIALVVFRVLCAKANFYCNATVQKRSLSQRKAIKFYDMKLARYFVVSVLCEHSTVARRVLWCAVLSIADFIAILATALVYVYLDINVYLIISCCLAVVLIIVLLVFANFNDTAIWTRWGTSKN
ncbi:MAG: hypothetical protein K2I75_07420 [Clostridiales bacterium]|nr:hypothetical protein [Clostridiales bacterium]